MGNQFSTCDAGLAISPLRDFPTDLTLVMATHGFALAFKSAYYVESCEISGNGHYHRSEPRYLPSQSLIHPVGGKSIHQHARTIGQLSLVHGWNVISAPSFLSVERPQ
jgi:hypothetical protein